MWKLTIKQERESDTSDYTFTEKIEFMSEELSELVMIIERLAHCKEVYETEYHIEKVGDE